LVYTLFGRRQQSSRWVFVAAAACLVAVILAGVGHGTLTWYAVLVALCVLQVVYPTLAGWCVVLVLFLYAACAYSFLVIGDLVRIWQGTHPPQVLSGRTKTVLTVLQFAMVLFVAARLPFICPRLPPARTDT
jgi:hypothetical protein